MRKLILFDIDQTLIKVLKFHSKAYATMFTEVFEIKGKLEDVKYDGKRFPDVVREIALLHDVGEMTIEAKQDKSWGFRKIMALGYLNIDTDEEGVDEVKNPILN